jgi:hypothetical protein
MPYKITDYSYKQAKKLNVQIKPSTNKKKKIDVFKNNTKIASIGAIGYYDYPTMINTKGLGLEYAIQRRKLYKERHKKDLNSKNGFYANRILW